MTTPYSALLSVEDSMQFVGTCDMGGCDSATEAIVFDGFAWLSACRACTGRWAAECRHCGAPPDPDGDHTCPCPHSDADCPDHTSGNAPSPTRSDAGE